MIFYGSALVSIEGKRMNFYPGMPEPFLLKGDKVAAAQKNTTPVLPTRAAKLLSDCVEKLDAEEVPAVFMHVPKRGDFFAFQLSTKYFGAVVVAKATGEKGGDYRKALPKGKPLASGTVHVSELKDKLAAAAEHAGEARGVRLTLTHNRLLIETVGADGKPRRDEITILKRSGQKAPSGLFETTSRWINPAHIDKSLALLLRKAPKGEHPKVDVILPLADEMNPGAAVVALQDPDGRVAIVAPVPGDKAAVALFIQKRAEEDKKTAPATKAPVVVPVAKQSDRKLAPPMKALPAPPKAKAQAHQPA